MNSAAECHQNEVFSFLQSPATHGGTETVIRIDTHGAAVFLAGPNVYKVKRCIKFPFMDFSTLAKRREACEAELMVNRANAPDLYLGVVPITRDGAGLHLGGAGEVIEWAVHLQRFDETATLDRLAAKGPLGDALTDRLARAVAAAHRQAPVKDGVTATRVLRRLLTETVEELAEASPLFSSARTADFGAALLGAFDRAEPLLLRRGRTGQVRHCHGDLHLGNLVLIDNTPVLFDAIEFDEAIAISDVLYDLAFLVMDLWERGLRTDANHLLNRYLALSEERSEQIEGLAALPLCLSLRAAIRAKVLAARSPDQALGYFEAASRFIEPVPPVLVAIGGLSGSGKTSLAAALAPFLGRAPGALHLRSDVERKRLFDVAETVKLPLAAYRPGVSATVYRRLTGQAETALRAGQAVVVDATHQRRGERDAIAAAAARTGVPFFGFWLEAPVDLLIRRVTNRRDDASDAAADVVAAQAREAIEPMTWTRLDATSSIGSLRSQACEIVIGNALPRCG
jgi:aminoglycoside phosphotransferase family enzyme/predicted kinase